MSESVLVIDGDANVHDALRAALAGELVDVLVATDAREGVRVARRERPAAVVLDPAEAEEAWKALRTESPDLPVVGLVRAARRGERAGWLDLGVVDFLAEPVDPVDARARLRTVLALARTRESLKAQTQLDPLTRCFGRNFLEERLTSEVAAARRHQRALGLLLVDVDGLDAVNASHGRRIGDRVLQRIAEQIVLALRSEDFVARYGADEFAVVVRETDEAGISVVGDRIAAGVRDMEVGADGGPVRVTVTVGTASLARVLKPDHYPAQAVQGLLLAAEEALDEAKDLGPGHVVTWDPGAREG